MRPKWHGKDWREFTCGKCGYWSKILSWCLKHRAANISSNSPACPDFEHRDVPDPDERTNLDHIREEDRL